MAEARYYYEHILHANWMAAFHKMRFEPGLSCGTDCTQERGYYYFITCANAASFKDIPQKFYIHEKSLQLLKPQEGDLVGFDGTCSGLVNFSDEKETIVQCDDVFHTVDTREIEIFQRHEIAFLWPTTEE